MRRPLRLARFFGVMKSGSAACGRLVDFFELCGPGSVTLVTDKASCLQNIRPTTANDAFDPALWETFVSTTLGLEVPKPP